MRRCRFVAVALLLAPAGCLVNVPDLSGGVFACNGDVDCAAGYTCRDAGTGQKLCTKGCSDDKGCPSNAPKCSGGWCTTATTAACNAMNCGGDHGKGCYFDNFGNPFCDYCDKQGNGCNNADLVCVTPTAGATNATCVTACAGKNPGDGCNLPGGGTALCAKTVGPNGTAPLACALCPTCTSGSCAPNGASPPPAYDQATICGGGTSCSAANSCTAAGTLCVDGTCRATCTTPPNSCGTSSACVRTLTIDGSDKLACKDCPTICDNGKVCVSSEGPNPSGPAAWADIIVSCTTPVGWGPPIAGGTSYVDGSGQAVDFAFALDPTNGMPVVAWAEAGNTCVNIVAMSAQTGQWLSQGCAGLASATTAANHPSLLLTSVSGQTVPVVAWDRKDPTTGGVNIYVATCQGGACSARGLLADGHDSNSKTGISDGVEPPCAQPAIGATIQATVAVWQSQKDAANLDVRAKFLTNPTAYWTDLGESPDSPVVPGAVVTDQTSSTPTTPALTTSSDVTYVAWAGGASSSIFMRSLPSPSTTDQWTNYNLPPNSDTPSTGGISGLVGVSLNPALATDAAGYAVVAWERTVATISGIEVAHAVNAGGFTWQPYGDVMEAFPPSTHDATHVSLGFFKNNGTNSRPIIAFEYDGHIYVRHYWNAVWSGIEVNADDVNNGISGNETVHSPKVAIYEGGANNSKVCVAYISAGPGSQGILLNCHPIM